MKVALKIKNMFETIFNIFFHFGLKSKQNILIATKTFRSQLPFPTPYLCKANVSAVIATKGNDGVE